jgi:hypothetical protein
MSNPQIEWADTPPKQTTPKTADLTRCPPGGLPPFIVLSDWITGNEMHWFNGRSFPHLKNECPACAAKRAKVWKGYIAGLCPKTRKVFLVEITPNCVEAASAYKLCFGSLRGAACSLMRSATKINGRVSATFTAANLGGLSLPLCPDVRTILQHMWQTDHRTEDSKPEDPRPVIDGPKNNTDLARRRPDRQPAIEQSEIEDANARSATRSQNRNDRAKNNTPPQDWNSTTREELDEAIRLQQAAKRNGSTKHPDLINEITGNDDADLKSLSLTEAGELLGKAVRQNTRFTNRGEQ